VKVVGNGYTKQDLLEAVPTARSVPQIFLNGEYVGGYDKLAERLN
jgi:glutaredoxin 3